MSKQDSSGNADSTTTRRERPQKPVVSSHIVTAEAVQAEEVPTVPLGPLQTLSALQPEVSVHSVASTRTVSMPAPLVVQPSEYRRSLGEWLQIWRDGIRPSYLPFALLPALLGSTLAWTQTIGPQTPLGHFRVLHFVAMLLAVLFLQVGANLVNDYYDYLRGIDTSNPLGPGGLIQQGLIRPLRVLSLGLVFLFLGAIIGAIVAFSGGPLVYLFGLLGLLVAFFYSATTRALSSMLLGEMVSFLVFGPFITLGAYMIQTGHPDRMTFLYSLPLGFLTAAIIHANNIRDQESDMQADKLTLAIMLSLPLSRALYILLLLGAYTLIAVLAIPHNAPHLLLITFWTLPTAVIAITGMLRTSAPAALHRVMRQTIKLSILFALLLMVGLIVTALLPVLPHIPLLLPL